MLIAILLCTSVPFRLTPLNKFIFSEHSICVISFIQQCRIETNALKTLRQHSFVGINNNNSNNNFEEPFYVLATNVTVIDEERKKWRYAHWMEGGEKPTYFWWIVKWIETAEAAIYSLYSILCSIWISNMLSKFISPTEYLRASVCVCTIACTCTNMFENYSKMKLSAGTRDGFPRWC